MPIQTKTKKPKTSRIPYPGDETVVVEFRRLGAHERSVLAGNNTGSPGDMLGELQQQGVGVVKWEGVLSPDGHEMPYSIAALDLVAEADRGFLPWFNNCLYEMIGAGAKDEDQTHEGKSDAPETGSTAEPPATPDPS